MRCLQALVAQLLLPAAGPIILATALSSSSLLITQAPSKAENAEAIAKIAEAITVRVEGAIQGSGVLVKRDGKRYTVLTAWHVVGGQKAGEELVVITSDNQLHNIAYTDIERIGKSDSALLTFSSERSYRIAKRGAEAKLPANAYVAGYPSDGGSNLWLGHFSVIGRATCKHQRDKGDLLYASHGRTQSKLKHSFDGTNRIIINKESDARTGVSGGPVLLEDGSLLSHHNAGVGTGINTGNNLKFGLNRGASIKNPGYELTGSYNPEAIYALFDSYEASTDRNADLALDAALKA
jgi:hypothetical protein